MKKFFSGIVAVLHLARLCAQDTPAASIPFDTLKPAAVKPLLYNYSSATINNLYNEDFREGANNRITADFDYWANSNSVPVGLVYKMIFKGDITQKLKDRGLRRMNSGLRFEDFMKTGITYKRYLKKWDGVFFVSYHHRQTRNISASKDAYQLAFYGNARFENDTIDLSNIRFRNLIYSQTTAGVQKKFDYGSYQMQFGMGLSFLQVINSQDIATGKSWLYTAPDGEYIDASYDLTFNSAKEGATNFGQLNGIGGSGEINLGFMNRDKWKITADLSDFGFLKFKKNPVNYSAAKDIHFQGITIPDLTTFSSQTFDTLNLDSAARANLPTKTNNEYSMFMPFSAQLTFSKPLLHNKLVLNAGFLYRYLPHYYGYGYVKLNYFIKPDMVFSATAGGGNYSLCNIGVEFAKRWKYFDFALGSGNLIGLVAPNNYTGTALYLRLASSF